jgi:hypothetical protein
MGRRGVWALELGDLNMTNKQNWENNINCYFIGLAYQGKDIVFRFIIEYNSSLMDFYRPLGNNIRSIVI